MCGIAGIVNFDGTPVDRGVIEQMVQSLVHRGPDGAGIWVEGPVGLGHRRLAIRDLSDSGREPMWDASGTVGVVYNGEIYNEAQLRLDITQAMPMQFKSTCDAEVIAPAYLLWDTEAIKKLQGMFAFALWDKEKQRLVLARDPVGIKPLYYSWDGSALRFGSEIKAVLAVPAQRRALSAESVHRFLAQGYPGPTRTLLEDVHPLPPGSLLIADARGVRIERYWSPARSGELVDLAGATEEFDTLFTNVVSETLISDVPVGLLLSGGIDSSLIASRLRGKRVRAFTAQFTSRDYDETQAAKGVARTFGLEHRSIPTDTTSGVAERFVQVVKHFDGNCADSSAFAFHAVCEAAKEHVPVLLSGDGADEFFGGYETYRASRLAHLIRWLVPAGLAQAAGSRLVRRNSEDRLSRTEKIGRFVAGVGYGGRFPHPQWRRHVFPDTLERIAGPALVDLAREVDPLGEYATPLAAASGSLVDRTLVADQAYYLPGDLLVKTDAMSMAHGIEVRVPFLDRRIMEFAGRLHARLLTPLRGPDKKLLREALVRAGGDAALVRARKRGFNVPVAFHLRNGLRVLGDRLLGRSDVLSPYLSPDGVSSLWREHLEGRANHGYALWTLLTLAVWRDSASLQ